MDMALYLVAGDRNDGSSSQRRGSRKWLHTWNCSPIFDQPGVLYEKCTEFIFTENMRERKKLLEEKSDATIVAPGGIGTYEELFEIFTLKSLKRIDRPIVLYNIDGYYDKMKHCWSTQQKRNSWNFPCLDLVVFLDEPTAVLDYLENYKK